MSTVDFLEVAQHLLQNVTGSTPAEETIGAAQVSQAAALIAIAKELRSIKAILCNATTLGGAIKANSDDNLEQISNHLDDIGSVLLNARGPDGAIKVTQ